MLKVKTPKPDKITYNPLSIDFLTSGKKYHLKHRSDLFSEEGYLHKFVETGTYFIENEFGCDLYQTEFSVPEIGELVRDYDVLFYFEMRDVKDYD